MYLKRKAESCGNIKFINFKLSAKLLNRKQFLLFSFEHFKGFCKFIINIKKFFKFEKFFNIKKCFKILAIFKKNYSFIPKLKQGLSQTTTDLKHFQQIEINLENIFKTVN